MVAANHPTRAIQTLLKILVSNPLISLFTVHLHPQEFVRPELTFLQATAAEQTSPPDFLESKTCLVSQPSLPFFFRSCPASPCLNEALSLGFAVYHKINCLPLSQAPARARLLISTGRTNGSFEPPLTTLFLDFPSDSRNNLSETSPTMALNGCRMTIYLILTSIAHRNEMA